ncbi:MAG: murein biosynthesis integral membrane protein MurJ [Tractidigestivibacter sp.]|uniref:murein biosynthesis integral membrane protein MurJ n=1 Tax=Tractidigestivibacter sp. TaxID=2847320 RepID=UPI002A7F9094|nr:murein biosynthesis integral membrane protein MurJ [Tractidigestivibacter sp.]MDY4534974.1 murein biosynthesis integral membrane protein MurJ [Tractidigestivibacter sp.]
MSHTPGWQPKHMAPTRKRKVGKRFATPASEGGLGSPAKQAESTAAQVGRNAALMSALVVVSRITGFFRTWGQSFALGAGMVASCYSVANNLPNQLYEIVVGGMLVTAFLPVYMSVKQREGTRGASRYTSNLASIVTLLMGAVAILGFVFAAQLVWTQSFSATSDFDAGLATYLFRFFVVEVVLYSLSSIFSGVLNAERDYFWSSASSIFNNFVITASFLLYAALVNVNPTLATLVLAIGNPAGVAAQVLVQMPSLCKHGIRLTWHVDWRDPALKDTLSIGIPSLVVMITSFVTTSVQQSTSLSVSVSGASVIYYARLWYTLPYAILAVPITTAMFTELSDRFAHDDIRGFKRGVASGMSQILFFMVPFGMYLIAFSMPLASLVAAGKFTADQLGMTAAYICGLACALPFYGIGMYFQKVTSSMRRMRVYALANVVGGAGQVAMLLLLDPSWFGESGSMFVIALTSFVFFLLVDAVTIANLRSSLGSMGFGAVLRSFAKSVLFGLLGALAGAGVLWALTAVVGSCEGHTLLALAYCVAAGIPSVLVTYGLAVLLKVPEARFIQAVLARLVRRR